LSEARHKAERIFGVTLRSLSTASGSRSLDEAPFYYCCSFVAPRLVTRLCPAVRRDKKKKRNERTEFSSKLLKIKRYRILVRMEQERKVGREPT